MASLTGKLVADTYKALLKLIDNDILTASEKQISDGFGGGSGVFIDQNGFLRASQYKVTGGNSSQFLKGDGSLDNNTYLPTGTTTSAIAEGTRLYFTTARVLATTLAGFNPISGTVTASDTILSSIEKIWWNIENGGGGGGGGYVPYTGATQNLNLGTYGLISDFVQFNTTNSAIPTTAGTMSWNDADGTADLKLKGGNVTLQIGQEEVVRIVNKTGVNLLEENYQAVYISGAQGQRLKVDLALATTDGTSAGTLGLVTEDILNNEEGFITSSGLVNKIDTTGDLQGETWADGDILYLSPTVAGQITNVKPLAPDHTVIMGFVVYAHANNGKIYVKVDNGYEIEELHDVQVIDRTDTDILQWYEDDLVWRNIQFATALENAGGIIGLGDINYVPRFDGINSISNSRIFDDLDNVIIGGTVGVIPNPYNSADMLTVLNGNISVDPAYAYHIGTYQILYRQDATGEFRIGTNAANDFTTFFANGSEKVRITTAGYLGVGLTAPSSMIHAKDSSAYGKIIIDNTGATGGGSFSARQNGTETAIFGVSGAWQANTTSDAAIVATRAGQGIKFYTNGSATAKGGIDSVGNSFIGQLPAYYTGATNFIVQGISAAAMIGVTHMDNSIKGVFSTLNGGITFGSYTPHPVIFYADEIESARIASDGKWLFGTAINDNVNLVQVNGSIIATSLKKSGGTSSEFLKADGSVDNNSYYLASNPSSFIALTALSSTALGLTYTNTTGIFSLTAGFEIPTTTDTTNWDIAYVNRITSATAPLSITSNVISISQASGSTNGYLSSTDWNTFNNKQAALGFTPVTNARTLTINGTTYDLSADRSWTIAAGISTLTTLGTSGPATLVGSTLNVPNYSAGASAVRNVSTFTATSGQTTFTIVGGYTVGLIDVFINGARLSTADYTATNSSTVVLGTGAVLNDIVDVVNYTATFTAGISGTGTANYLTKWTGSATVNSSIIYDNGTNVGISTASPAFKLDVNGTFNAVGAATFTSTVSTGSTLTINTPASSTAIALKGRSTDNYSALRFQSNTGATTYSTIYSDASNLIFENGGSERMRILSTGFVGINTASPSGILEVTGNVNNTNLVYFTTIAPTNRILAIVRNADNAANIDLRAHGSGYSETIIGVSMTNAVGCIGAPRSGAAMAVGATTNSPLVFGTNNNERMRIQSNGEVGIATSSTSGWALSLGALGTNGGLNITVGVPTLIANFNNSSNNPTNVRWSNYNGNFYDIANNPSTNSFTIDYNDNERFRIASSGNILIGITTDNSRLTVDAGAASSSQPTVWLNQGVGGGGYANIAGTDSFHSITFRGAPNNSNNYSTSAEDVMSFVEYGGQFRFYKKQPGLLSQQVRFTDGVIYAVNTSVQSISDIRTKENIVNSKEGLNIITDLRPVRFDFKNGFNESKKNQLGFIAQEIEKIFPDAMGEWKNDNDGITYKTVGPSALIPVIVKAIQELKSELDQLKAK